jgi:hypothetical protein
MANLLLTRLLVSGERIRGDSSPASLAKDTSTTSISLDRADSGLFSEEGRRGELGADEGNTSIYLSDRSSVKCILPCWSTSWFSADVLPLET